MDTDVWKARALVVSKLFVIVAACAILTGCDDNGPTAPTTPRVAPTPNVAGNWQGVYRDCSVTVIGCSPTVAAAAAFIQDGSRITGRVTTESSTLNESAFEGSLVGDQLRGTLTAGGERKRVTGSASANRMMIMFSSGPISQGTIELNR
jgi:hypothetical protein